MVDPVSPACGRCRWLQILLALMILSGSGCAALTNPVAEGVPVRMLPPELLAPPRDAETPLPLTCLQLPAKSVYRLAPGDVLGVWIDGVLPTGAVEGSSSTPPVHIAPPVATRDSRRLPPAAGYPVPVEDDGTISLPLIPPVSVQGRTLAEARAAIREAYTTPKQILKPGAERLIVTLLQPREIQVTVFRQESSSFTVPGDGGPISTSKRGTAHIVDLPAYQNDVLHALAQTGGLPGLDAFNEIVIQRGGCPPHVCDPNGPPQPWLPGDHLIRIPLRLPVGQKPPFHPHDIELRNGDVVYLEARDDDLFYTGGLLPASEWVLPRDHDLDVVEAVALVQGAMLNGAYNTNNLSGTLLASGIGNPSPSLLVVLRRTPGGGQVPIRVDLNRALCDARERLIVRSGDVLLLQETPGEAMGRYFTQTFFNFSLAWQVVSNRLVTGVIDIATPQQLPASRINITNLAPIGQ